MAEGWHCEACKDFSTNNVSGNKTQILQLEDISSFFNYLNAHDQKILSKKMMIDEKDIRLFFRKSRARDKKESETAGGNADISTTFICNNDRVPHIFHDGLTHRCHCKAAAKPSI